MLTDTHCHLYLEQFAGDIDAVIQRASNAGIGVVIIPGMDVETSRDSIKLAETYPNIFAAVGYHPTEVHKLSEKDFVEISKLAEHPKVVAIGEIGLDYYWVNEPDKREMQRNHLASQLELAQQANKPVILHLREENNAENGDATNDMFALLENWHKDLLRHNNPLAMNPGVFHSFGGNLESARRAIGMNFYVGITGPVTYKKNASQRELVRQLPLDHILIETDSPFQTPLPHRGKRNEPEYVTLIADKIAEVHRTTREAVSEITTANANRLFGWEANA